MRQIDLSGLNIQIVKGNLLNQNVEVIVNAWNRNIIPWWMLLPQGISGAIKRYGGCKPFQELRKRGILALGEAVLTSAGTLPFKGIIHVAGINIFWCATEKSISRSVINAIKIVNEHNFSSVAFPIIGAGSGNFNIEKSKSIMLKQLKMIHTKATVIIVEYNHEKYNI